MAVKKKRKKSKLVDQNLNYFIDIYMACSFYIGTNEW